MNIIYIGDNRMMAYAKSMRYAIIVAEKNTMYKFQGAPIWPTEWWHTGGVPGHRNMASICQVFCGSPGTSICMRHVYVVYVGCKKYTYIYICICICICIYMYMYLYMYVYVYAYVNVNNTVYKYLSIYLYVYTYIHLYISMCIYIFQYIYVCVYAYRCIYVYMAICIYVKV